MNYTKVANSSDLALNEIKPITVEGKDLALVRTSQGLGVVARKCTHMGADLCKGKIEGNQIVCAKHGARFDAQSGQPCGDAKVLFLKMKVKALPAYSAKEENGAIYVAL